MKNFFKNKQYFYLTKPDISINISPHSPVAQLVERMTVNH